MQNRPVERLVELRELMRIKLLSLFNLSDAWRASVRCELDEMANDNTYLPSAEYWYLN